MERARTYLHGSLYQWVEDGYETYERKARAFGLQYTEIVNGSEVPPQTILRNITQHLTRSANVDYNKKVLKVTDLGSTIELEYKNTNSQYYNTKHFDNVVVTVTSPAVSLVKFSPPLDYAKT